MFHTKKRERGGEANPRVALLGFVQGTDGEGEGKYQGYDSL